MTNQTLDRPNCNRCKYGVAVRLGTEHPGPRCVHPAGPPEGRPLRSLIMNPGAPSWCYLDPVRHGQLKIA